MAHTHNKNYPHRVTWQQEVGYVLTDKNFIILANNQGVSPWVESGHHNLVGQSLFDVFPEFIGVEDDLSHLHDKPGQKLRFPKIHRPSPDGIGRFFDLYAEPQYEPAAGFLVIITDVTEQATYAQRLQQQRNELRLVSAQLTAANEQLAFLLKQFVPKGVAQRLIDDRKIPPLGVEGRRDVTILFADVRNYSGIAEGLGPEQTMRVMNAYLDVIARAIWRHNGSVNQFVGDLLMASFNAPDPLPDHPLRGVQAALDVRDSLEQFACQAHLESLPSLGFGIGFCTGQATTGYLGVESRFRYSVIGDTTNVASHLCSLAKAGQIIVGQPTLDRINGTIQTIPIGETRLKQRRATLMVHELVGLDESSDNYIESR